ncbi:MAG: hypothetical protein Q4D38_08845 [Planctomycetia bacterium]|nr:hypothetical protein [Planctomycetia bacterium]
MVAHSWLLTKKRGNHRTGSQRLGLIAEIAFAGFCILGGVVGIIWILSAFVIPEWAVYEEYHETACELHDFRVVEKLSIHEGILPSEGDEDQKPLFDEEVSKPLFDDDGAEPAEGGEWSSAIERGGMQIVRELRSQLGEAFYQPEFLISYQVGENSYKNWATPLQSVTNRMKFATREEAEAFRDLWVSEGQRCCYDPENPDKVVIFRDRSWENFFSLVIPVSFLVMGIGTLGHSITTTRWGSKEYSAANLRPAERNSAKFGAETSEEFRELVGVPSAAEIMDSPGIRLAYRLPMVDSPAFELAALIVATLVWNLLTISLLVYISGMLSSGELNVFWILYAFPFAAVDVWLTFFAWKKLIAASIIGPTIVEIDHFPLENGDAAQMFVSQGASRKIYWLNIILICEEEAVFTHGTNTRRERKRVYQELIYGEEGLHLSHEKPFDIEASLQIPLNAMHSFVSPHNQVNWKILIQGAAAGCEMFERYFPIIVCPPGTTISGRRV